ncbi:MAG: DUF1592 domain-containing protein [Planctomycetaceae bacterium]|nr:DUF1592 domain-containing protein [Planctomycetaceae bacterium]
MDRKHFLGIIVIGFFSATALRAELPETFLKQYCYKCHGSDKQQAERRFDTLPTTIGDYRQQEQWQDIVDQINLGEMPPVDEKQPSQQARLAAVRVMTGDIAVAREKFAGSNRHTVLRRLNTVEYQKTISDLLGLNVEAWNPTEDFPAEVTSAGFDNDGAQLVTSGLLLEKYFPAAESAVKRATHFGPKPEVKAYAQKSPFYFSGKEATGLPKLFQVDRFRFVPETAYTDLYGRHYRGGHIGFLPLVRQGGVAHSGKYTIRVRAAAVDRTHVYGNTVDDFRNGDPLVLEIASVDRRGSVTSAGNVSNMVSLTTYELTSAEPQWFEWTGYLEQGYEPEVRFRNGTSAAKRLTRLLVNDAEKHPEFKPFALLPPGNERSHGVLKAYRGPKLRIWEIQLEGPHQQSWPPPGHRVLYGGIRLDELNSQTIDDRLIAFARGAFRRPPTDGELQPILALVKAKLDAGLKPLESLQLGFQAILCAPGFLYLQESEGQLEDYALASRLSYFLWSSMPDDELLKRASGGTLGEPETRRQQVARMLSDPKGQRFVSNFTRIWLELDNIGKMPPSKDFLNYYRDNLGDAMRKETELFFGHILDRNLPIREFLAADYSFLNRELAEHYGMPGLEGNYFRKVNLPKVSRGGIMGHASFLTASANGVDTSPVVRGIYVLNKLLGYSPPSPPGDVPAIDPDVRGATTLREQLIKHRADVTCAQCHNKIDPPGFALENYDAIGGWRDQYPGKLKVDASGKLTDGKSFASNADFRTLIVAEDRAFTRCLTEKLLTYAIGRKLNSSDRPSIDRISKEMVGPKKGLRDLIQAVVASESFLHN